MILNLGGVAATVRCIKEYYGTKFSNDVSAETFLRAFAVAKNEEPPVSMAEILRALSSMKPGRATGVSKVSCELLQVLAGTSWASEHGRVISFLGNLQFRYVEL